MMQTPGAILWFSRLYLGSLIASVVVMVATWDDLVKDLPDGDLGDVATYGVVAVTVLSFGVSLLLWRYIMRRRSRTARTILTVLSVLGAILIAIAVVEPYMTDGVDSDQRPLGWRIAENAAVLIGLVANALLFAPGGQRWFAREENLSNVFS